MTYPRLVIATWFLALLLACALAYDMAHAGEWAIDLKGGASFLDRTTPDGTYYQEGLPHSTSMFSGAWAVGLTYRATPNWSFSTHWLDLGTIAIRGQAVSDDEYDYKKHLCIKDCHDTYTYRAKDSLRGVDATVEYRWATGTLQPFVKGGVAVLRHKAEFRNQWGQVENFNGIVPELELGAGLAYKWAYIELDYFRNINFGGQNLPISTQQVVLFAGIQIPVGW